mmetsp:Transcript_13644/g.38729  ORF Transcript_13644/g.38729 Transcript_13644/m.38729 type:complete len:504 (-) Transcript_13644:121-1632(-)
MAVAPWVARQVRRIALSDELLWRPDMDDVSARAVTRLLDGCVSNVRELVLDVAGDQVLVRGETVFDAAVMRFLASARLDRLTLWNAWSVARLQPGLSRAIAQCRAAVVALGGDHMSAEYQDAGLFATSLALNPHVQRLEVHPTDKHEVDMERDIKSTLLSIFLRESTTLRRLHLGQVVSCNLAQPSWVSRYEQGCVLGEAFLWITGLTWRGAHKLTELSLHLNGDTVDIDVFDAKLEGYLAEWAGDMESLSVSHLGITSTLEWVTELASTSRLRTLHIGDSNFVNDLAQQLEVACLGEMGQRLEVLSLPFAGTLGRSTWRLPRFLVALSTCPRLRVLDLRGCMLGEEHAGSIAAMLDGLPGLAVLRLGANPHLGTALPAVWRLPALCGLDLIGMGLTEDRAIGLADLLSGPARDTLRLLDISALEAPQLSDAARSRLVSALVGCRRGLRLGAMWLRRTCSTSELQCLPSMRLSDWSELITQLGLLPPPESLAGEGFMASFGGT